MLAPLSDPPFKIDIDFTNFSQVLIGEKDGLFGIVGKSPTKYARIEKFEQHLAKATLPDGSEVYLDLEGNEY